MTDYAIVVTKLSDEDGGGYLAVVPDLYGCMSDGESPEEALRNAQSAIDDWIEVARELGRKLPEPGSAAKQSRKREAALVQAIKILTEQYDGLDERIESLVHEIDHVRELVESQAAWGRIDMILNHEAAEGNKSATVC